MSDVTSRRLALSLSPSYSNSSLYKALLPKKPAFDAHRALPDARATADVLATRAMSSLLSDCGDALISLEQLVLKAHADYNTQFADAAPAKKARVCGYCKGTEQPYHASKTTCPKLLREKAAAAGGAASAEADA